jgi:transposase-like protein
VTLTPIALEIDHRHLTNRVNRGEVWIVEMALNASGIRDTARVLHVSPTTVIKELKKRQLTCNK